MTVYHERDITGTILTALEDMPVVVISGMRQVGKSTFLRQQPELAQRTYFTFDDYAQLNAARENPDSFVERYDRISIDEAQKFPELLVAIKRSVDRNRKPGRFLLSGSANFLLLKNITESLAGRAIYYCMLPFTRREIIGDIEQEPFLIRFFESPGIAENATGIKRIQPKEVLTGGLPVVCLAQSKQPRTWFQGFEQTYLERDIRELSQVADLVSFHKLMRLAALRTGQLLRVSEIGRDAGIEYRTATRYLNLMETSFAIRRLEPYLASRTSRLIKSPKIYISDSGLGGYLAGMIDRDVYTDDPLWGAMFETYIIQNLAGIIGAGWPRADLYFWNVQGRYEVDAVVEVGRDTLAIEIKWGERWAKRDLAGLKAFLETTPRCRAAILGYNGTTPVQLDDKLYAIPLGLLLS